MAAVRRLVLVLLAAAALVVAGPAGVAGAGSGERIRSFDVQIAVEADGTFAVTETIAYDFGVSQRHGIFRDIPVRFHFDDRFDRLTPLTVTEAGAVTSGTPGDAEITTEGALRRIRLGDPDRTISGRHTYRIAYRVKAALNSFESHEELFWNATGTDWSVPIDEVKVTVTAPAGIGQVTCFAGASGSRLPCDRSAATGSTATFSQTGLGAFEGLTVVVALPKGTVAVQPPVLEERWSFARAFSVTPLTVGLSAMGTLAVVVGLIGVGWRTGRDRRWQGSPVDQVFGSDHGGHEAVPLFDRPVDPVEYVPPDGILPGQVGTLLDEEANPLDVSATIVDLAVRGYLRIEEIPKKWFFSKVDWKLVKLRGTGGLHEYERLLFNGLFQDGDEVELSDLRQKFTSRLRKVQEALYDDMVDKGWFYGRPDKVRSRWVVIGVGLLLGAGFVTVLLAANTTFGLLGIPLVIAAVGVLAMASKMPRRTPAGVAALRRVNGFRRLIVESEAERARFAERAHLFSEYLPYAIVFGVTEKWAKAFGGLEAAAAASATTWYVSSEPFSLDRFGSSVDSFSTTASGTIVASAASSGGGSGFSGGSSGGGFGGGGGGSW